MRAGHDPGLYGKRSPGVLSLRKLNTEIQTSLGGRGLVGDAVLTKQWGSRRVGEGKAAYHLPGAHL